MSKTVKIIIALVVLAAIIGGVFLYFKKSNENAVLSGTKLEEVTLEDGTQVVVDYSDPKNPQIVQTLANDGLSVVTSTVGEDVPQAK